jgi:hypothetical protein
MLRNAVCARWAMRFVASLVFMTTAYAQVPNGVGDKLMPGSALLHSGKYYANAIAKLQGTRESMESMLSVQAMHAIAYKMCGLEPAAGLRLQAKISGLRMVSSELIGSELSVIMSAPEQTPSCQLIVIPPPTASANTVDSPTSPVRPGPLPSSPANTAMPSKPGASDITIRNFGNEY